MRKKGLIRVTGKTKSRTRSTGKIRIRRSK